MKKYLTVNKALGLLAVGLIVASHCKFDTLHATMLSGFTIVITIVVVEIRDSMRIAKESFNNPCRLSMDDAGCSFSVEEIRGDKIGLIIYGPDSDSRFLIKAGHMCYFWIDQFPHETREVGAVIHVRNSSGSVTTAREEGLHANLLIPRG